MHYEWGLKKKKKIFPLAGELTTDMRFAVLGDKNRFIEHKHAWKAWRLLKDFGCKVFPVAEDLKRIEGTKVYSDLISLNGQVDVVIPCLKAESLTELVKQSREIGAKAIWFQEGNWNEELQEQCSKAGIIVVKGCVLKHKIYSKPFCFLNPCYWHGLRESKVPSKR